MASCSILCLKSLTDLQRVSSKGNANKLLLLLLLLFTMKHHCARLEIQPYYAGLLLSQHQPLTFKLTLMTQNSRRQRPLNVGKYKNPFPVSAKQKHLDPSCWKAG